MAQAHCTVAIDHKIEIVKKLDTQNISAEEYEAAFITLLINTNLIT